MRRPDIAVAGEGHWLVVYDVKSDRLRQRIYQACLDYDLKPIQYSAFLGHIPRHLSAELYERLRRELGDAPGTFIMVPVCSKDWRRVRVHGSPLSPHQTPYSYIT